MGCWIQREILENNSCCERLVTVTTQMSIDKINDLDRPTDNTIRKSPQDWVDPRNSSMRLSTTNSKWPRSQLAWRRYALGLIRTNLAQVKGQSCHFWHIRKDCCSTLYPRMWLGCTPFNQRQKNKRNSENTQSLLLPKESHQWRFHESDSLHILGCKGSTAGKLPGKSHTITEANHA